MQANERSGMTTHVRAIAGAAIVAVTAAAAIPAITGAQTPTTHDITVREKVRLVKFVHVKPGKSGDRLGPGDRVITKQALFDESNAEIGAFFTDCVSIGPAAQVFKATLQCTSTYRLRDGQIVTTGVVRLSASGIRFPIVGGAGAYSSARGEVEPGAPVNGYDSVDVLHVAG